MPLETAAGIWDLNASNPPASDQLAQTDDHLRLIKAAILASLPNINAPVTTSDEVLNELAARTLQFADGSVGSPSVKVGAAGTQGFYKAGTNKVGISGRLTGDGAIPVGACFMFPRVPSGLKSDGSAGGTYIELNGGTYNFADYPDLGAFYGVASGTFVVDDMYTTGRFPRSRTGSLAVGTTQANQNKAHTHAVSGTAAAAGGHTHIATSVVTDPGHGHPYRTSFGGGDDSSGGLCTDFQNQAAQAAYNGVPDTATGHLIGGNTTGITVATTIPAAVDHTHTVSGTAATDGGTEARPESLAFIFAVKT
jgi:hypothetical protein